MDEITRLKLKRMAKNLSHFKGNGTSMITLYIKPGINSLNQVKQKLIIEEGAASNIKSRVNRQSVLSAIKSTSGVLKSYNKTPNNGLAIFCGDCITTDGKEKKVTICFSPPEPLQTSGYTCSDHFDLSGLDYLFEDKDSYGYVIIDGDECIFSIVTGSHKDIKKRTTVDLPKKQRKGGQSAARFGRIRQEKIGHYLRLMAEEMNSVYLSDNRVNVRAIILAGPAEKKNMLKDNIYLDDRIKSSIRAILDIQYGGKLGLDQAIRDSMQFIQGFKLNEEKNILSNFFTGLSITPNLYAYSVQNVITALEGGLVDTLIVWDNLSYKRWLYNKDGEESIYIGTDYTPINNYTIISEEELLDWILEKYKEFGCESVQLVTDITSEGSQFSKFGGLGAILRFPMEVSDLTYEPLPDYDSDDEDNFI